jgi:thiamine pyrophosphate-dependent acetolactate synthase large subunit-like protein
MTTRDALALIVPHLRDEVRIHANGFLSRAACAARDTDTCFYMIGSMGLASSIGLGIALAQPSRRVLVFDGDGNVLMNAGALARIAAAAPRNFLHLCFDNGAHASTGGQRTISDRVKLESLAGAAGYRSASRVETPDALAAEIPKFLASVGPAFLLVKVEVGAKGAPGPRVPHTPEEMTARMRRALGSDR